MSIFEQMESEVRTYCRSFPTVFTRSKGSFMYDEEGKAYVDFFAGAGALNYGHNNDYIKSRVLAYMTEDNITHSLDMSTTAKAAFLENSVPRFLNHVKWIIKSCSVDQPAPTPLNALLSWRAKLRNAQRSLALWVRITA